jgi:hypothetical protein
MYIMRQDSFQNKIRSIAMNNITYEEFKVMKELVDGTAIYSHSVAETLIKLHRNHPKLMTIFKDIEPLEKMLGVTFANKSYYLCAILTETGIEALKSSDHWDIKKYAIAHPSFNPDWECPKAPANYPTLVALFCEGSWDLDFLKLGSSPGPSFASEIMDITIQWPWKKGFNPTSKDWNAIHITAMS